LLAVKQYCADVRVLPLMLQSGAIALMSNVNSHVYYSSYIVLCDEIACLLVTMCKQHFVFTRQFYV